MYRVCWTDYHARKAVKNQLWHWSLTQYSLSKSHLANIAELQTKEIEEMKIADMIHTDKSNNSDKGE